MSDRYGTDYPEDEPIIGGGYAPPAPPPLTPPGQPQYAGTGVGANYEDDTEDALESYEDDEYDEDAETDKEPTAPIDTWLFWTDGINDAAHGGNANKPSRQQLQQCRGFGVCREFLRSSLTLRSRWRTLRHDL